MAKGKQLVIDQVIEKLNQISPGKGYWLDPQGRIFGRLVLPEECQHKLPYICVVIASEDQTYPDVEREWFRTFWSFEIYAFVGERVDDERYTSEANDVAKAHDDIFRALTAPRAGETASDWTFDRACVDSRPISASSTAGMGGQPDYGEVVMRWQVQQIMTPSELGASPAVPLDPSQIEITPYFWFRSDLVQPPGVLDGQGMGTGSGTSAWPDKSVNARTLLEDVGQTIWRTIFGRAVNGKPLIEFDSTETLKTAVLHTWSGSWTLAFVHRVSATQPGATYKIMFGSGGTGGTIFLGGRKSASASIDIFYAGGPGQATIATWDDSAGSDFGIFIITRDAADGGKHSVLYGSDTMAPAERGSSSIHGAGFAMRLDTLHGVAVGGCGYCELVGWDSKVPNNSKNSLYQYMALEYAAILLS